MSTDILSPLDSVVESTVGLCPGSLSWFVMASEERWEGWTSSHSGLQACSLLWVPLAVMAVLPLAEPLTLRTAVVWLLHQYQGLWLQVQRRERA